MDHFHRCLHQQLPPHAARSTILIKVILSRTGFRRGFLLSYPRQIFRSLLVVQESIFKILNNRSIGQGNRGTLRIHLSWECWEYLKLKGCNHHISFHQKKGTRVDRISTHDLMKGSKRRNVNIEIIEAATNDGVKTFKFLFGLIILYGARTKPASLGNESVGVLPETIINVHNRIKFTYIIEYEMVSITILYTRALAHNDFRY